MTQRIPTTVITGFLGVGKTTAILDLLERNRGNGRWAVLVNEFGEIGIDGAAFSGSGVAVREVPGGCICCSANMTLRVALTELLRKTRPQRLLIEPTGLGHLGRILAVLQGEALGDALELKAVIGLVDPNHFTAERLDGSAVYREQLELADIVALNKLDRADPSRLAALKAWLAGLYPPKLAVEEVRNARLDPAWLDWPSRAVTPGSERLVAEIRSQHHTHEHGTYSETVTEGRLRFSRVRGEADERSVCGWVIPATVRFDEAILREVLTGIGSSVDDQVERAKGVFRCESGWRLMDMVGGEIHSRPTAWRQDSRLECIGRPGARPAWRQIEAALLASRRADR